MICVETRPYASCVEGSRSRPICAARFPTSGLRVGEPAPISAQSPDHPEAGAVIIDVHYGPQVGRASRCDQKNCLLAINAY